jgi:hypothetical protein
VSRLETIIPDDEIDMPADAEIRKCLDLDTPKSFFLLPAPVQERQDRWYPLSSMCATHSGMNFG